MKPLKRYSVVSFSGCRNCGVEEDADGENVEYADVEKLLARVEELEATVEAMEDERSNDFRGWDA